MSLTKQLVEYLAGRYQRVPAEHQAIMHRDIDQLRRGLIAQTILKAADSALVIVLVDRTSDEQSILVN